MSGERERALDKARAFLRERVGWLTLDEAKVALLADLLLTAEADALDGVARAVVVPLTLTDEVCDWLHDRASRARAARTEAKTTRST